MAMYINDSELGAFVASFSDFDANGVRFNKKLLWFLLVPIIGWIYLLVMVLFYLCEKYVELRYEVYVYEKGFLWCVKPGVSWLGASEDVPIDSEIETVNEGVMSLLSGLYCITVLHKYGRKGYRKKFVFSDLEDVQLKSTISEYRDVTTITKFVVVTKEGRSFVQLFYDFHSYGIERKKGVALMAAEAIEKRWNLY